jgi:hypothetical protein
MESPTAKEYEIPLHLELSLRKAELAAQEMTWDQLFCCFLNLYKQRILELQAIKDMLQNENIEIEFDLPTDLEICEFMEMFGNGFEDVEDDDDGPPLLPF